MIIHLSLIFIQRNIGNIKNFYIEVFPFIKTFLSIKDAISEFLFRKNNINFVLNVI